MTPFILDHIKEKGFEDDLNLFSRIHSAIQKLPDIDLGSDVEGKKIILNCHMLARATAKVFPQLILEEGWFNRWPHSWLITPHKQFIDVYPIGILSCDKGGPIYVSSVIARTLYRIAYVHPEKGHIVTANFSDEEYLHGKVDIIAAELAKYTS